MSLAYLPWDGPAAGTEQPSVRDATRSLTYHELQRAACEFACQLSERGVSAGDVVATNLPNSVDFVVTVFAAWAVGASVTPVNPTFTGREFDYQISDSGAEVLVGTQPEASGSVLQVISPFLIRRADGSSESIPVRAVDSAAVAFIVYTSGSTGRPKGVELTHSNLIGLVEALIDRIQFTDNDHALLILPLFHVNSLVVSMLTPLAAGGRVTLMERFVPELFLAELANSRPTYFSAVPALYARLLTLPADMPLPTGSLRFAVTGAAPASPELIEAASERLGVRIIQGYGLTEATCASTVTSLNGAVKPGSVGTALAGQQVRIVNDRDEAVPTGERGEIVIAGSTVMRGYHGNPEATAATVRSGWLHTGDVGILDEDGDLFVVDRIKDMIIRGGENIYPRELELVLTSHPSVVEAAVVGAPDPVYGEVPVAFVVASADTAEMGTEQLLAHCREGLAKVKLPVAIHVLDVLPRNPVGKIDKPALRQQLAAASV